MDVRGIYDYVVSVFVLLASFQIIRIYHTSPTINISSIGIMCEAPSN